MEGSNQVSRTTAKMPGRTNAAPTERATATPVPSIVRTRDREIITGLRAQRPETSVQGEADSEVVLEEHFTGTVEAIEDDRLRLRLVSADGEEITAWLPLERVPASEQKYVRIGAVARVAVVKVGRAGSTRREHRVRFPRPTSLPLETHERMTDWLVNRMEQLLARPR